jgi:hypothetical protein
MLRIYKHYAFAHHSPSTAAQRTSFSSYPGVLSSLDDFYLMDSGLAMIQTTNSVLNMSLYDSLTPQVRSRTRCGERWRELREG